MRPQYTAFAALAILATSVAIVAGGRAVQRGGPPGAPLPEMDAALDEPATAAILITQAAKPAAHSRAIEPEVIAQPRAGGLERAEPRPPLSDLALATPPKPKMPDEWKGTKLFQPVASAAGLIEAKGYSVAVSGLDIVRSDETCGDGGGSWACGIRARTAFRGFLRGRAVVCAVPPEGGRDLISAQCRIGKQDIGEWLVENGWARAARGGPYAEAGDKARAARKGIFGAAPDLSGLPPAPAPMEVLPAPSSSILDLSQEPATPPTGPPALFQ